MCNVLCSSWTRLSKWVIFNLLVTLFYNILLSVCVPSKTFEFIYSLVFLLYFFFNLVCNFEIAGSVSSKLCFLYIFPQYLSLAVIKTFSDCCLGMSKVLHQNNMEELKGLETMRSLCDMLVSGGVRSGCR